MSRPVTIAAVMPAYNRQELVGRAIESILAQSRPADRIIVVDDGSTDGTAERVERFGSAVTCVRQSNGGGASARNRGVAAADTDWVAFLDSDDLWEPDHLARLEAAIGATRGRADLYFADTRRPAEEGGERLWQLAGFDPEAPWQLADDASEWVLMARQPMMLQSAVVRRERFLALGGLRVDLVRRHDTDLFLRMGLGGSACAVAGVGVRMTADDRSAVRLTRGHGGRSRVYWECSVRMYAAARQLAAGAQRSELRRRLGHAHWRLGRLEIAQGRPVQGAAGLARGMWLAPGDLWGRLIRR